MGHVPRDVECWLVSNHAIDLATHGTESLEVDDERTRGLVDRQLFRRGLEGFAPTQAKPKRELDPSNSNQSTTQVSTEKNQNKIMTKTANQTRDGCRKTTFKESEKQARANSLFTLVLVASLELVHFDKLFEPGSDARALLDFDREVEEGVKRIGRMLAFQTRHPRAKATAKELVDRGRVLEFSGHLAVEEGIEGEKRREEGGRGKERVEDE